MERSSTRWRASTGSFFAVLPPGELIPGTRYRILSRIGQGAMGAVYAAEHVDLEKRVALKTLHGRAANDPAAVERFRQEARAASKIGSPFICDVTDFGSLPEGQVFYVMEYLDGPSLRRVLEEGGPLAPARAVAILRQVCKALGAAHDKGIIHLDMKPDNVMLLSSKRRGDVVKIVDFGIAGLMNAEAEQQIDASPEDKVVGTPDYLPPERVRGKGYDHRSDIYSLGATAYEMLSGTCVFPEEDVMATLTKHVVDKPEPLRQRAPERKIPAELEAVVMNMLEKNPAARPRSMAVVEAMLCEAQIAAGFQTEWDDLELPAVDEDWQRKLAAGMPSPRSRHLRRLAAGLGLAAALGLGLALYFGLRKPTHIIEYKPVYVEVTKTDEPEEVAPWLKRAVAAAGAERFFEPAEQSALHFLERADAEAKRLGVTSGGAASLRRLYGNQFKSLGQALARAGLTDLAAVRYRDGLRFLPGDPELRAKLGAVVPAERPATPGAPAVAAAGRPASDEGARRAAANVFAAATSGRFSQARVHVEKLRATDSDGQQAARMADELRRRAGELWDAGKQGEARLLYQLVWALDPKDTLARERAEAAEMIRPPATPVEEPAADESKPGKKRTGTAIELGLLPDPGAPRNRASSSAFARQGAAALGRGDLASAEEAFNRAVRADASNPEAVAGLAEVAFERARYTEALDYGRRAIRHQPRVARYHLVVGDAYFKLLRYDEAATAYERALALAPRNAGIAERLERVKAKLGK